jgi:hypothetical protein
MNRTSANRSIYRMTVEVFEDQVDALKDLHYKDEKLEPPSMSAMVRAAIDDFIQKRRRK